MVTVDSSGQELGKLDVEEVMAMSAAGRYLAVLYADSLVIYTSDMTEYARLENTGDTRSVLAQRRFGGASGKSAGLAVSALK